ncbi:MAG: MogA/MoaB family molybdenum cofactor biosynthesis protein [Parvibaculales bacterium]
MPQNPDNAEHAFTPLGIAVMTISDTRKRENDISGNWLAKKTQEEGHHLIAQAIIADNKDKITAQAKTWIGDKTIHAIIATGGTGLYQKDVTPEAFHSLYEKEIEGFSLLFHQKSLEKIGFSTLLSRASAGLVQKTCLFSLPGSPNACKDGWQIIRFHLDRRSRPCNLAELLL